MEILSDATFRGNVDFRGQSFTIYGKDGPIFYANSSANHISEFGNLISNTGIATNSINLRCSVILSKSSDGRYSYTQCLQAKDGTIALTSDIPSLSGYLTTSAASSTYLSKTDASSTYVKKVDALKYKRVPIDFDVPANCTKFFTADGTGVCSDNILSLNLLKNEAIDLGQSNCGAVKQVQADVWAIYGGQNFVVEKSSAFAISSSDGYVISAVYY